MAHEHIVCLFLSCLIIKGGSWLFLSVYWQSPLKQLITGYHDPSEDKGFLG